jgi:hypothetical protein
MWAPLVPDSDLDIDDPTFLDEFLGQENESWIDLPFLHPPSPPRGTTIQRLSGAEFSHSASVPYEPVAPRELDLPGRLD